MTPIGIAPRGYATQTMRTPSHPHPAASNGHNGHVPPQTQRVRPQGTAPSSRMRSVLIVLPDAELARLLSHMLQGEEYSVRYVTTAQAALEAFVREPADLIVVDTALTGFAETDSATNRPLQWLRERSPATSILVLGSGTDLHDPSLVNRVTINALEWGADDFVAGVNPRVLLAHIRALLRRSNVVDRNGNGPRVADRLEVGPVVLDVASREVWCNETPVDVTPTEFKLLHYFMREAGRVLTFQQIISEVWGYEKGGDESLIRVHVSRLRKKLAKYLPTRDAVVKEAEVIVSHPRVGYSMPLHRNNGINGPKGSH